MVLFHVLDNVHVDVDVVKDVHGATGTVSRFMSIRWGAKPPKGVPDPSIRVLTVHKHRPLVVRLLDAPKGVWVHWLGHRSLPCREERCEHCGKAPLRWKAYAPCVAWLVDPKTGVPSWVKRVVELTENAVGHLRLIELGRTVRLTRKHEAPNAPVLVAVSNEQAQSPLPPSFDVIPYMERVWGALMRDPDDEEGLQPGEFSIVPLPPPEGGNSAKRKRAT